MPLDKKRQTLNQSARYRALRRLGQKYPDEFRELFEEELRNGPSKGSLEGVAFNRRQRGSKNG